MTAGTGGPPERRGRPAPLPGFAPGPVVRPAPREGGRENEGGAGSRRPASDVGDPPAARSGKKTGKKAGAKKAARRDGGKRVGAGVPRDEEEVLLPVPVPRAVRKRLRARAAERGYTAQELAAQVLRAWLDG